MQVRGQFRFKARGSVEHNSGTFEGKPWENWSFEAVDTDDNKVPVHVPQGMAVEVGKSYDVLADVESKSGVRIRITAITLKPAA